MEASAAEIRQAWVLHCSGATFMTRTGRQFPAYLERE